MKVFIYQHDKETVFRTCLSVIRQMQFQLNQSDLGHGCISSYQDGGAATLSSLLDLRICEDRFSVCVNILSSSVSNIFGTIFQDNATENDFIERLFMELHSLQSALEYGRSIMDYQPAYAF